MVPAAAPPPRQSRRRGRRSHAQLGAQQDGIGLLAGEVAYAEGETWLDATVAALAERTAYLERTLAERIPAAGYHAPEYAITLHALGNLSTYSASYYHRVNQDIEASARATYDSKASSNVNLEVGTKTYLDNAAFIKAKINNSGILALGYAQALRPGIKATFGLALDTIKLSSGSTDASAHKLGAALTFEA